MCEVKGIPIKILCKTKAEMTDTISWSKTRSRYTNKVTSWRKKIVFQKELYNSIPNVTVWQVLQKCSHLE
jgi:hypothetical protein